jgi:BlaI family penicillinase repressor
MKRDLASIILTRQELQIMKEVWKLGSATVNDVCKAISQRKPTAYTTILTLMGILEEKGALVHSRPGRAYVYKPLLSKHQAIKNQIDDVLVRLFEGDPQKLVEYVVDNEILEAGQMENVRRLLDAKRENRVA